MRKLRTSVLVALLGTVVPGGAAWSQEAAGGPQRSVPEVSIVSPADGTATRLLAVDVAVSYRAGEGKGNPHVTLLELYLEGSLAASYDVPAKEGRSGTHTFAAVSLAGRADSGVPATLSARAYQGNPKKESFRDSLPVRILVDTRRPAITALSPGDGAITSDRRPVLSGTVTDTGGAGLDVSSIAVRLDGRTVEVAVVPTDPHAATFSHSPPGDLSEGPHAFTVEARDRAGNAALPVTASFVVDATPPAIADVFPDDGAFLGSTTPTFSATVADEGGSGLSSVRFALDGQAVAAAVVFRDAWHAMASFTPAASLPEGPHRLTLTVLDRVGNQAVAARSFTIDATPPTVAVHPADGSAVRSARPTLSGTVTDTGGAGVDLSSVTVRLDGVAVEATFLSPDPNATQFAHTPPADLAEGPHTAAVEARDRAGNAATGATSTFVVDVTPPTILNVIPRDGGFTRGAASSLTASLEDSGGSGLAWIRFTLDGTPVAPEVAYSTPHCATASHTAANLAEGSHTLVVTAADRAGNEATATSVFVADRTAPAVSITVTPGDPGEGSKTITVTFHDALSGVTEETRVVLVDLVDRTAEGAFQGATWTFQAGFEAGTHSVVAEARDRAGNAGQATAVFEVKEEAPPPDTRPPTVAILFPNSYLTVLSEKTVPVLVKAQDHQDGADTGIATVELRVNGAVRGTRTGSEAQDGSFYSFDLKFTEPAGTSLVLEARAMDAAGNVGLGVNRLGGVTSPPSAPPQGFRVEAPASVSAGEAFTVRVTPVDAAGNPVVLAYNEVVYVRSALADSYLVEYVRKQQAFTDISFTAMKRGPDVLWVESMFNPAASGWARVQVNAGPVAGVEVEYFRESRLYGGDTLEEVRATALDAAGNPVPGVPVDWTLVFFQEAEPAGGATGSAVTGPDGTALAPAAVVPGNATRFEAVASVNAGGWTVTGTASGAILPKVVFNVAFQHQAVEAGVPAGLTITAIDLETGRVKTDYAGTVYLYRYSRRLHGEATAAGGETTPGEIFAVVFTAEDGGIKFVEDGIVLTERGETLLAVSTVAPSTRLFQTRDLTEAVTNAVFGTVRLLELEDPGNTVIGYTNEIVVLPARPARFTVLSIDVEPLGAHACLVDRFGNPVFLEPVEFTFTSSGSATVRYTAPTNAAGYARGYGPTDLPEREDTTVTVKVIATRYPPPDGVPAATATRTLYRSSSEFVGSTAPTVIELGKDSQPVSSLSITEEGQTVTEYVDVGFSVSLIDENASPNIRFRAATFSGVNARITGALSIEGTTIRGIVRNTIPYRIPTNEYGSPIPVPYTLTFALEGILVDVPGHGAIAARHPDGRLNVQAAPWDAANVRTVAYFGKTMAFVGSVVPEGTADLGSPGRAGVYIMDAEHVTRALIPNPGLIAQDPSGTIAGTFRIQVMDREVEFNDRMKVRLESLSPDGAPLTDPETGETLAGTVLELPLGVTSTSGGTLSNVAMTGPVVAVDRGFQAEEAVGGKPGQLHLSSQSSLPADGEARARIDIRVTFPDGTPAPGATVTLTEEDTGAAGSRSIVPPGPTDASGRTWGYVSSDSPGTVKISAEATVPDLDLDHPGFAISSSSPLRILFFTGVRTLTVVPGGVVRATLEAPGFAGKPKEAVAAGVAIEVQPESEGAYRPAAYAVVKGTLPKVRFTFIPSMGIFHVPDPGGEVSGDIFDRAFRMAIVVDDGEDGTSLDRGDDPGRRVIVPGAAPWSHEFVRDAEAGTLTWSPSMSTSPFRLGANRIRAVLFQTPPGTGQSPAPGAGPATATARMLIYSDEEKILISPYLGRSDTEFITTAEGEVFSRNSILLSPRESLSDAEVSTILARHRLAPVGMIRDIDLYQTMILEPREALGVSSSISQDDQILAATADVRAEFTSAGSERIPREMFLDPVGAASRFDASSGRFVNLGGSNSREKNAFDLAWPHLVMKTFAAHRLAEVAPEDPSRLFSSLTVVDSGLGSLVGGQSNISENLRHRLNRIRLANHVDGEGVLLSERNPFTIRNAAGGIQDPAMQDPIVVDSRSGDRLPGHGTAMTHLAVANGLLGDKEDLVLGTGRNVDHVNIIQNHNFDYKSGIGIALPLDAEDPIGGGRKSDLSFRILASIMDEADEKLKGYSRDPLLRRADVVSVSQAWSSVISERALHLAAISEIVLDKLSQMGVIVVLGAGNRNMNVSRVFPAAVAPSQGGRMASEDSDARNTNHDPRGGANNLVNISSPLVVTVGGTQLKGHALDQPRQPSVLVEERYAQGNWGNRLSVSAPAERLISVNHNHKYTATGGTSPATALVSGILAEMVRLDRGMKREPSADRKRQLIMMLEATADPLGDPEKFGFGRVNFWKAMLAVSNNGLSEPRKGFVGGTRGLNVIGHEGTQWYGLEIRTRVRNSLFLLGEPGPRLTDSGNAFYPLEGNYGALHAYEGRHFESDVPTGVNLIPGTETAAGGYFSARCSIRKTSTSSDPLGFEGPLKTRNTLTVTTKDHQSYYSVSMDPNLMRDPEQRDDNVDFDDFVFTISIPQLAIEVTLEGATQPTAVLTEGGPYSLPMKSQDDPETPGVQDNRARVKLKIQRLLAQALPIPDSKLTIIKGGGQNLLIGPLPGNPFPGATNPAGILEFQIEKIRPTVPGTPDDGKFTLQLDANGTAELNEIFSLNLEVPDP